MFRGKLNFLGTAIPTWLVAAALLAATAGAAVGIVLSGGVTGDIITTVDQGLLVDAVSGAGFNGVSDDKTGFTSAKEIATGDKYDIQLELQNRSQDQMAVSLNLDVPPGITVHATSPRSSVAPQSFNIGDVAGPITTTLTVTTVPIVDRNGDGEVTVTDVDCTPISPAAGCTKNSVVDAKTGQVSITLVTVNTALGSNDVTIGYDTGSNITQLVRTGLATWLFKLSKDPGDGGKDLKITIAHADDATPGFYTITGDLRQSSLKP